MRKVSSSLSAIIFTALLVFISSTAYSGDSSKSHKKGYDHISGASKIARKKTMPPKSDDYQVFKIDGVKNYIVKYDEKMYRGGEMQTLAGAKALKKLGIKTIVSITPTDEERKMTKELGLNLVELEFHKTTGVSPEQLKQFLKMVHNEDGPFYVHCHGGNHRAGILASAYRMHELKWSKEKALLEFGFLGGSLKDDYIMIESITKTP
ncbi:MAG: hypothetical protein D6B28_02880 [Gammaproteobacteria bacterium]|nr:MAG: hypothetical protein D6B28_02880 [Gammaproteobacteria bacterium]